MGALLRGGSLEGANASKDAFVDELVGGLVFSILAFFPFAELESSLESFAGRGLFLLDALGWRGSSIVAGNIFGEVMLTIFVLPGK